MKTKRLLPFPQKPHLTHSVGCGQIPPTPRPPCGWIFLQRFAETVIRSRLAVGWAGVFFLLLCGSCTGAWGQAISNPNQIYGTISWNNNPLGPVGSYLNSSARGLGGGVIYARDVGGLYTASTGVSDDPSHMSAPYSIDVQAGVISGIQHNVSPQMFTADANTYWFETALSGGVIFPPATPDVLLDFTECAGLVEVQFCDPAGSPVVVNSGYLYADVQSSGARQAEGHFSFVSSKRLAVRGGNTFSLNVNIAMNTGTDVFSDYFSITYSTNYTVTVGCDEIVIVKFIVPPSPIGSGEGGSLSKIIGIADVLGKSEHWINQGRTIVNGFDGPFGNYRYDNIEPLSQPGYLPCAGVSPQVGTLSCNSAGPFSLVNLLPSNFSTPARNYTVAAAFNFDLNRRYELFVTPYLYGVTVPSGGAVDLGNAFVVHPGYVVGDIFLCGPDEEMNANSPLRHIYRASDSDGNGDGIPEGDTDLNVGSKLMAFGLNLPGAGAAHTAEGGHARLLFEGDFVAAGQNKNHFVGDYNMTLGGLFGETTRWNQERLQLYFGNVATPTDRDSYINSVMEIYNKHFADVEIVPGQTVRNDHRYGLSQVIITFNATSGTLFGPTVYAAGTFNGSDFEGNPAHYTSGTYGYGTPISLATATSDGQVVLCMPEGNFTFYPTVYSVNPDGSSFTLNTLPPFSFPVGPCEKIIVTPGLVLNVNTIPECVAQPQLALSGSVSSAANVASITYTLNGNTVTVCNNCGLNPSFNFNLTLADCDNALQITATDVNGLVSSRSKTIHFDGTPPVLSGCVNKIVPVGAGQSGAVVAFIVTAMDNCDGAIQPVCSPASGSFFPLGSTEVTCTATDACGNPSTCTFTVTVSDVDRTPPTIQCPGDIITATDPGRCSAVVTFTSTASDNRPGVTFACSPPSGSAFPKGTTTVTCTATDAAGNTAICSFTITVKDREAPTAGCIPTTNPAGGNVPNAGAGQGSNPKSGQNPDGFYQLMATDNCDAAASLQIFVKDSAEGPCGGAFLAGPYKSGDKVKLTQSPGQQSVKPMAGVIVAHINTNGDPVLVVVDSSGNAAVCTKCLVPQPPK